jgi:hypothetical protein
MSDSFILASPKNNGHNAAVCSLERGRISDCSFLLGARFRKPAQNFEFLTIAPNLGADNGLRTRECKIKTLVFAAALIFSGKDREANSSMKLSLSIWQIFHHSEHFFKSTFQVDAYSSAGRVRENIRSMYCAASPRRNLCAIGPTMQRHVTQRRKRLWVFAVCRRANRRSLLYVTKLLQRVQNGCTKAISFASMMATRPPIPRRKLRSPTGFAKRNAATTGDLGQHPQRRPGGHRGSLRAAPFTRVGLANLRIPDNRQPVQRPLDRHL